MVKLEADQEPKQRIYASWTKGFREYTEPFIYMEREEHVIDTTIIEADDMYYRISKDESNKCLILEKSRDYPQADILIHPESHCSHDEAILNLPQAYMYSTAGMIRHASRSDKKQFIIATEIETIHKLKNEKSNAGIGSGSFGERAICS